MDKKDKQAEKENTESKSSLNSQQLLLNVKHYTAPLARHAYFIFIMLIILGLAACLFFIMQAFQIDKKAYEDEKLREVQRTYSLDESEEVADEVLQSETADAGPIQPNYDPGRDNPFFED